MRIFDRYSAGVLCDPVSAISGGIGLVGNVVGGIMGNSAAKKAAGIQSAADTQAASDVTAATAAANPAIGAAADKAGALAQTGAAGVTAAAGTAATGATTAAADANKILDPYSQAGTAAAGTLQTGLAAGGDFNKTPSLSDLQMDPGYAFRLQAGQQALSRSSAARGAGDSGSAMKDMANYSQGAASQEYQNAFNRYQTNTQNRYSNLFGEQGVGLTAGAQQGANTMNASQYAGNINTAAANTQLGANEYSGTANINAADLMSSNTINTAKTAADYRTGAAAATAGGIVGGTNALTSGINGGINSATSAARFSQLMQNPALMQPQGAPAGFTPYASANPFTMPPAYQTTPQMPSWMQTTPQAPAAPTH